MAVVVFVWCWEYKNGGDTWGHSDEVDGDCLGLSEVEAQIGDCPCVWVCLERSGSYQ